jgi:hypothetical protein
VLQAVWQSKSLGLANAKLSVVTNSGKIKPKALLQKKLINIGTSNQRNKMTPTLEQRALLKKHGFQWYKDGTTDRVSENCIADILPAANGFTVVYVKGNGVVLEYSTAKVSKIDIPEDPSKTWIRVYWDSIEDERRD